MPTDTYKRFVAKAEKTVAYWQELGLTEFLVSLREQMQRKQVKPAGLAKAMGVSRAYVSKVLSGEDNLTFATMVRFAMAVGAVVHVHVADRNAVTRWLDQDYSTRDCEASVSFGDDDSTVGTARQPIPGAPPISL
jgi:plasmid maintenance system antidote protein VapI